LHAIRVGRPAKGEGSGHRLDRPGAEGEEERVVLELHAGLGARDLALGGDLRQRAEDDACTRLLGQIAELEVMHVTETERLRDRQRPVPEMRLGSQQLQVDAILGEVAKRKHRLEGGDAASGDEDSESRLGARARLCHGGTLASANLASIGIGREKRQ
jgi:hypothetical protein